MTVIVGLKQGGKVWMGGDSAAINEANLQVIVLQTPKVFRAGPFLIGFADSLRTGQLLAHALPEIEEPKRDADVYAWMVTTFVEAVKTTLASGGTRRPVKNSGMWLLVAYRSRLFEIDDDFTVYENAEDYAAIGCGDEIALGALYATKNVKDPRARVRTALKAAQCFSAGVREPFKICCL